MWRTLANQRLVRSLVVQAVSGCQRGLIRAPRFLFEPSGMRTYAQERNCCTQSAVSIQSDQDTSTRHACCGCGAVFQSRDPRSPGFVPEQKLQPTVDASEPVNEDARRQQVVCQRCFSLKHYNTALNISLQKEDYVRHLQHIKGRRVLVLLMVDLVDFPGSLFPELNAFISPPAHVMIVANKVDLLSKNVKPEFWNRLATTMADECVRTSLAGCNLVGVHFVSAKTGDGVDRLTRAVHVQWGNRGDVYLLGCTNVGKSSLFNRLLTTLCGARPGELQTTSSVSAPVATVSHWPGTTLGLLKFPLLSVGKRNRLISKAKRENGSHEYDGLLPSSLEEESMDIGILTPQELKELKVGQVTEDVLSELGLLQNRCGSNVPGELQPKNRFWLYDTPGAINDAQLINLLTTEELRLGLPKKALKPRTFILKPGQTLFIGGLARLDYHQGEVSIYFTVFAASYLPVHITKTEKADALYRDHIGTHLLKIPVGDQDRLSRFPQLLAQEIKVTGSSWKQSAVDIVLSSAGWVAVTIGGGNSATIVAATPLGKGIVVRSPPWFPSAVTERGKRSKIGNRASFKGV